MHYLNYSKNDVSGVVLAGGRSNRFGQDKCLYVHNGITLTERAVHALLPWCGEIMISTNKPQEMAYLGLQTISDLHKDCGPLGGIHSGLQHSQGSVVVFTGCDMPYLDGRIIPFLINNLGDKQAVVPTHGGFRETLCLVLRKDSLAQIESALLQKTFKLLDVLQSIDTVFAEVSHEDFYTPGIFHNINTREDLKFEP